MLGPVHNHGPDNDHLNQSRFIQTVIYAISNDPSLPIRAYNDWFMWLQANQCMEAPGFDQIRSTLHRHRATLIPPVPASIRDVQERPS